MLTEENDSSLTSFFILFENASIASCGIRYALHKFFKNSPHFGSCACTKEQKRNKNGIRTFRFQIFFFFDSIKILTFINSKSSTHKVPQSGSILGLNYK